MKRKITKKFGDRVRELRSAREITQEGLAERSGLSRQYIGDIERGVRNISLINIEKLQRLLALAFLNFLISNDIS
ncbi:MAG: transcriptional regulator [Deltaproteobacteria bacterium CG12_big_fil_rev_8_21_14_0_65_43_10]|nr:MAG: hypothetical protein AUK23_11285 [Deltaproteobacteria bacterium CG2_30_43_15]PIQ45946.1 MAG: transcriptional regulator [Deltaproteobacteria bacterium CG12_big_fil_rev_8_21_14_0_65_43_10]PIU84206.1 MAG: transcriptional regulator [Deltaproteobacteria bacterium CG06_land_8_20_14_3_00_44_19]PIX22851.1 MAG: transcriptional regulator [Deltaproteobacteria bacterium CG_4_8_14_3_um_filter_43_13]PIZ20483.1 MAG: transcriptional regulator [Deltaproteobacteria bacterium CG_4_10_14_0_8_um_filter_43_1